MTAKGGKPTLLTHTPPAISVHMLARIWRGLIEAPAIVGCRNALRANDLVAARKHYSKFENNPDPRLIALGARLHISEGDSTGAKPLLEHALKNALTERRGNRNNKYVAAYCRYLLSLLAKDDEHEIHRLHALSLNPSDLLFDTLPLPPSDVTSDYANPSRAMH